MTRDQVRAVASCGPYLDVAGTGGLECPAFMLGARKMNISFVFSANALSRIQLWFYEGDSEAAAKAATTGLIEELGKTGRIRSDQLPSGSPLTAAHVFASLKQRGGSGKGARVQILTERTTAPFIHGSITQVGPTYFVFLFYAASNQRGTQP